MLSLESQKLTVLILMSLLISGLYAQWNDPDGSITFTTSHLPILIVDTDGNWIPDTPRIPAKLQVIDNGPDNINSLNDSSFTYNGRIAIELRGSSSAEYPKKQYRFETQDVAGENFNVSLLGLPRENDWILYGPYDDESLIRNALAYKWSNDIGRYAPRTKFCELVLNDDYRGLYLLIEKIKRDNNRVDIARLDAEDSSGETLSGGYIIKIDKEAGENNDGWISGLGVYYQYDYPKPGDITSPQKSYIRQFMNQFETAMLADWKTDATFLHLFDLDSFVDYFLLNEMCKNVDAFRISCFLYKDRDSNDGRLMAGPIWDFNLSMGKAWYPADVGRYEGWQVDYRAWRPSDYYQAPFWWEKLAHEELFAERAEARWKQLRQSTFSRDSLFADIDGMVNVMGDAINRNFQRWPLALDRGRSYEFYINELKQWLTQRLAWMDLNISKLAASQQENFNVPDYALAQNYPNPFNLETTIPFSISKPAFVTLEVFNTNGQKVATLLNSEQTAGTHVLVWRAESYPSGLYMYRLQVNEQVRTRAMLLIK